MWSQEAMADWLSWVWLVLFNHLWQATAFAALALLVVALMKRGSARGRYLILMLASAKFVIPSVLFVLMLGQFGLDSSKIFAPSVQSSLGLQADAPVLSAVAVHASIDVGTMSVLAPSTGAMSGAPLLLYDYTALYYVLTAVWFIGFILLSGRWAVRRRQLSLALRAGERNPRGREYEALNEVLSRLRIQRRVELIISPKVTEPGVWGVFRAVVVLPTGIGEQLSDAELEAVMLHEMIHVIRWDNLVSNLQMILCCLFWFNPLVWLLDKRLLAEREQTCDEKVIRLGSESSIYASSITKIYRFCLGWKVGGLSSIGGSNLRHRIERITANDLRVGIPISHRLIIATLIGVMVLFSGLAGTVSTRPLTAQDKEKGGLKQEAADTPGEAATAKQIKRSQIAATTKDLKEALAQTPQGPHAEVTIRSSDTEPLAAPPLMKAVEAASQPASPKQSAAMQPPSPEQLPLMQTAHAVDLRKYVGRYAVDPTVMENFVFDVSLDGGSLWLKPSHAQRRRLIAKSDVEFRDETSDGTSVTFNWDETGNVTSMTYRGWGPAIKVAKLVLPQPSVSGNVTFRLSGHAGARIVAVAGTFNNWNQSQFLFAHVDGEWICKVNLPPGKYEYKFIVDGNWLIDPRNKKTTHDDRGIENSVLIVE